MTVNIRPAVPADAPVLRQVEVAAGQRFRDIGLDAIADDEPPPVEILARFAEDGRAWAAVDTHKGTVGFVLVEVFDGAAHIAQVSVAPTEQGQGIGRALIDQVGRWANPTCSWPSLSRLSPTCHGTGPSTSTWASRCSLMRK